MSGERYIKQAIISALCEHPDQERYRTRAFSGDNLQKVADAISSQTQRLSKADFFTPDDDGKFIIDTPGFWQNFEKIHAAIRKNGENITADDLIAPLDAANRRTLLGNAAQHNGLKKLFTSEVWQNRFDEMEGVWFKVPVTARREAFRNDGTLPLDFKRSMLQAEGRSAPEDRLLRAGLSPADIHNAFRDRGDFDALNRRLAQAGDFLRKEYLLIPDSVGDTAFCHKEAWNKYPALAKTMQSHGQQMEVRDFIRQIGFINNVLARAAENKALDKVFSPELWTNRLGDMIALWSNVREGWKMPPMTSKDFDLAYATAESNTYSALINMNGVRSKIDLLSPLNDVAGGEKPVLGLGLKSFWDNAGAVQAQLATEGQKISLEDLRRTSGQMGNTCMMSAVKFGHFNAVTQIARSTGAVLTVDDFLSRDPHGNTMLSLLVERNELPLVFVPDLWVGRVADMKALWSHVRSADHGKIDINKVEVATKQATLRQMSKNKFKL